MSTDSERFERLPKWAQREFDRLEMRLDEARTEAARNLEIAGLQRTEYGTALIVPTGRSIYFGEYLSALSVRYERGVLYVHGHDGGLVIRPRVSNGVEIVVGDLW